MAQISGLTADQVAIRQARGETNAFDLRVGRTYWQIIRYNVLNIFNLTLFILLVIVLLSRDYTTVIFAGAGVVGNSLIGTIQEINAKRKLDQLARLSAAQVDVLRDGHKLRIESSEVVQDDVIFIRPGDRLVADGVVLESDSLEIDESHLTGEADPVPKEAGSPVSSGAFCIAGRGLMQATRVGSQSTANRISSTARRYKNTLTPTQVRIASIVQFTLFILAIFGPMIFIAGYITGIGFLESVRNTIVFVTTLVPQGLILVIILSLTIGAVKISRRDTLIQRINAVESLANVTTLCFDKTGTITRNQLTVTELRPLGAHPPEAVVDALQRYIANLTTQNSTVAALTRYLPPPDKPPQPKQREIAFKSARRWGAVIFPEETLLLGAPETVLPDRAELMEQVTPLTAQGLRVLAFARIARPLTDADDIHTSDDIEPLALVIISDQVRDDIQATLDAFRAQHVSFKVISGDNVQTVCAIAHKAGIPTDKVFTGAQIKAMSPAEVQIAVKEGHLFARVEPDTKRMIVAALQRNGDYVAMVGDGVNDVPALKEADLAIVMNDGAQISKDVADIVLLNNALSTLPLAFREGREITQTIYGTSKMYLTKNFYNVLLFIFILFMALPFPITPVQISWVAFATTNLPSGLMAVGLLRPQPIRSFRHDVLDYIVTSGLVGAVGMALLYVVTLGYTQDLALSRAVTTLYFSVYGWMIVLNTHGIDFLQPRTLLTHWRTFLLITGITGSVVGVATLAPSVMEFQWPPLEILLLALALLVLCMVIVSIGMRNRGLLHQFYTMTER